MNYELVDSHVYGKVIAKNGRPLITNYDEAMKLAERFNGMLWKIYSGRYMVKVPDYVNSLSECDCQSQPTGEPMPQTYNQYPDHEVQMARQELYRTAKLALMIHDLLKDVGEDQGLEGWVQRKLTRAADYIESVFDYLDYEMRYPSDMYEDDQQQMGMQSGGPQNPSPTQQTQQKPGTPPKAPGLSKTPGMVKMAKLDTNGNVQGVPVMVPSAQVKSKQQAGFHVIGESASAGASSAGGIAGGVGAMGMMGRSQIGSLFGGTYTQKKKKKKVKEDGIVDRELQFKTNTAIDKHDRSTELYGTSPAVFIKKKKKIKKPDDKKTESAMSDAEKNQSGPKFTGYWKGTDKGKPGNKMVGGGP
jgi:hypothetical protein